MRMDPIVAEVRAVRDRLAAECGNDLREMFRQIREYQTKGQTAVFARRGTAPSARVVAGVPSSEKSSTGGV